MIRYGLGGAVALAAGGVGLSLQQTHLRRPSRPLRALDERTFSILAAVADRVAPAEGAFPAASELQVAEKVDELLAGVHPSVVEEIKQVLHLLENGVAGLLLDGRPRPFTALEPQAQDEALQAWRRSRLGLRRTAYRAIRGLCAAAYYASPEIQPAVGYPGPPDFGNLAEDAR
ncbi:MAG TPA: gluconate 2-dehydrogenase subunit 3 family protein [Vulgatibacter sp.]|nr:gluconate 2-dehydrogenase subunit 3 family protein [Vulgatibacter sp.]